MLKRGREKDLRGCRKGKRRERDQKEDKETSAERKLLK